MVCLLFLSSEREMYALCDVTKGWVLSLGHTLLNDNQAKEVNDEGWA